MVIAGGVYTCPNVVISKLFGTYYRRQNRLVARVRVNKMERLYIDPLPARVPTFGEFEVAKIYQE